MVRFHRFTVSGIARAAILLAILSWASAFGQTTGTVQGAVFDQQGGVLPSVKLELTNIETNVSQTRNSDSLGNYVFSAVLPGKYNLRANAPGFRGFLLQGVVVTANTNTPVDVKLDLGAVTETVTVGATAERIDTVSPQVATNVDKTYIEDLPNYGRNVLSLAELAPGIEMNISNNAGGSQMLDISGTEASVNGNRSRRNNFYLDGTDNTGSFRNQSLQFPNPDAVQAVQVSTSNTSAEFGRQVGGSFNVITKSGTNNLHGSGFYFFRIKELNANDWSRNRTRQVRPDEFQKSGGGTIGGPIRKDKTFFFGSVMVYRDKAAGLQSSVKMPTAAMNAGDLSSVPGQLFDPDSGQPLPGNQIPKSLMDPVAVNLSKLIPTVANWNDRLVWAFQTPLASQELMGKIDHQFTSSQSSNFSLMRTWGSGTYPALNGPANNLPAWGPQLNKSHQTTLAARHTWVARPNLIVEGRFGLSQHVADRGNANLGKDLSDFGAQNFPITQEGQRKYLPIVTFADGPQGSQGWLSFFDQHNFRIGTTTTWIKAKHHLKFGSEFQRDGVRQRADQTNMTLSFTGRYSANPANLSGRSTFGFGYADFLMGRTEGMSVSGVLDYDVHNWTSFHFIQDEWKLTKKLTLSPGLRYEIYLPTTEKDGRMSGFVRNNTSKVFPSAPLGMAFPGDPGVPKGFYSTDWLNLSPRMGAAYDINGNGRTVLRGGFGLYYSADAKQNIMIFAEQAPWRPIASCSDQAKLSNPWLTCRSPIFTKPPTPFTDASRQNYNWPPIFKIVGYDPNYTTPYNYQFNLTLARELRRGLVVSAGYVGNRGHNLTQTLPINWAPYAPGASDVGSNIDARRPIKGYSNVNLISSAAVSSYNSLQVAANLRLGNDLNARFTYVYQRGYSTADGDPNDTNPQTANPLDPNGEWAENQFHQAFKAFYTWQIPLLRNRHSLAGKIAGGWQLSGTYRQYTGSPSNVLLGTDWNYDGITGDRPDQIAPITYARTDIGNGFFQYIDVNKTPGNAPVRGPFALPGGGTNHNVFGTTKRNAVWNPGTWGSDAAMLKNFRLTESHRLQFRMEAFNIFNHPNLGGSNLSYSSSDFGKITGRSGYRRMQLALRYFF